MDPAMQAQIEGPPLTGALAGADESVTVGLGQQTVLFIMPEDLLANKQAQAHVAGHVAGQRIPWECVDTQFSDLMLHSELLSSFALQDQAPTGSWPVFWPVFFHLPLGCDVTRGVGHVHDAEWQECVHFRSGARLHGELVQCLGH